MINEKTYVHAVIVAAGNSTRMGENKMFISVAGKPVLLRTVMAFDAHPMVDFITVVTRAEDAFSVGKMLESAGVNKQVSIVHGGQHRIDSVAAGVEAVHKKDTVIAIHDGARPLVTEEIITKSITAALEHGGAIPAVKVKDTIKIVSEDGFIVKSPDRSFLYSAQTPQCFKIDEFKSALKKAMESGETFTDDAAVFSFAGNKVAITEGSYENIKITTYDDVLSAQVLLVNRRKDGLTL